mgnify:CR=1 FL=1|tara:strand:+ start:1131 stop:2000 length:870 start_codon:yes stop_codon:yes gene_type:complete
MNIVLTGSSGQVGKEVNNLLGKRFNVYSFTRKELDITDTKKVEEIISKLKPKYFINCAAYTKVDDCEINNELAFEINHLAVENISKCLQPMGAILIHFSTDYVFDGKSEIPYTEADGVNPINVYGISKLKGEESIKLHLEKHIVIRTSWVFGSHGNNFLKTMLKVGGEKSEVKIVNDQIGGPTFAGDIANLVLNIIYKTSSRFKDWGTYHFSGFPYVSWFEFAQEIFNESFKQNIFSKKPSIIPITTFDILNAAQRPNFSKLDCSKTFDVFAVEMSKWEEAIKNLKIFT